MDNLYVEAEKWLPLFEITSSHNCAGHMERCGSIQLDFICRVAFYFYQSLWKTQYSYRLWIRQHVELLSSAVPAVRLQLSTVHLRAVTLRLNSQTSVLELKELSCLKVPLPTSACLSVMERLVCSHWVFVMFCSAPLVCHYSADCRHGVHATAHMLVRTNTGETPFCF